MRIICSQELLSPVLKTMSRLLKQEVFPLFHNVLLSTHHVGQESLTLLGSEMDGRVGMLCSLPATIEEEGQVLVPIEPFAEYCATLRSGALKLSQERTASLPPIQPHDIAHKPQKAPSLTIESHFISQAGTISTNTARLKSWVTGAYPIPPIERWLAEGVPIATLSASALRTALARCIPIAGRQRRQKQGAPEMKGIFLQVHGQAARLTATTGTLLISHHIALNSSSPLSFSFLFETTALTWMRNALPEDGEITLSLTQDGQQNVLLLARNDMVVFCRSMQSPPPTWEHILLLPHEREFVVSRREFSRAIAPFAAQPFKEHQALALSIEGAVLSMRIVPETDIIIHQSSTLQLVGAPAPEKVTIFAHPKQLKQIVTATNTATFSLQIGWFERWEQHEYKRIGFLRIRAELCLLMMSLSKQVRKIQGEATEHTFQEKVAQRSQRGEV